jgi:guanine deaminase
MIIRGAILNPRADGSVQFIPDAGLADDGNGRIAFVGAWQQFPASPDACRVRRAAGIICPPFLDNHIHIPQHPIRGRFMEGVGPNPPEGRLIAGLNRNVFPAEAKYVDPQYTKDVVNQFLADTLAHGVVGGAAYMTVHPAAARVALEMLPATWSVGPVLMNMNCPEYLRTDEASWEREFEQLARDFGRRVIVTDRFAVSVSTPLRRAAVALAKRLGLRMQTHLNEQIGEKRLVEQKLYADAGSYTNVYARDGLLDCEPILAHCVRMSAAEFDLVKSKGACIAHCPTSNTLLGSGAMPLDLVRERNIDYAICTDVGASPTTSILCEMAQFLKVHAGHSKRATPQEALYRATLAPARMLGLDFGTFEIGRQMTFVEIGSDADPKNADDAIVSGLLNRTGLPQDDRFPVAVQHLRDSGLDAGEELAVLEQDVQRTKQTLDRKVRRVVVNGQNVWEAND